MISTNSRNAIQIVCLNRPQRRNALVPKLMLALARELRRSSENPSCSSAVLTGAGPSFCVGADLKWIASQPDPGAAVSELVAVHHEAVRAILESPVPVVAAVNGAAAGGGMGLALAADYRVASSEASFTAAYFRLGLTPDGGSSAFLARAIGPARAMELLLTNRSLSADQALSWGLLNEVVPPEALLERACDVASKFGSVPPETLLATRGLLDAGFSKSLDTQLHAEAMAVREAARKPEFKQALQRFLERKPS